MDLNSLAKTLAERAITLDPVYDILSYRERCEAVIREAIEKTLERAEQAISVAHIQPPEDGTNSSQVIIARRTYIEAIRSLKQSNSGRAEQGIVGE